MQGANYLLLCVAAWREKNLQIGKRWTDAKPAYNHLISFSTIYYFYLQ